MASHGRKISVTGLGYVGLPVAVAFGQTGRTIAYDVNKNRVDELRSGRDRTLEVTEDALKSADLLLTSSPEDLSAADFHIIAVPTPIRRSRQPDLSHLLDASRAVGKHLKKGDIVVYESTVFPGATEENCAPILESTSGLTCGEDFFLGYSPERINPGDREHTFSKITKVVSGQTPEVLDIVAKVYESVVEAGVHRAPSIKVAEAAKVIENTQRDLNIALMNELALIFNRMHLNTGDVLEAAGTKWNFLPFKPGLVGGHCIGVDPYYLTYKAEHLGYHPEVILAGRRINNNMGRYIARQAIKRLSRNRKPLHELRVAILGLTFKEDCPDLRNSRVIDVINELKDWGIFPSVHDPLADKSIALTEYGIALSNEGDLKSMDAVLITVAHKQYRQWNQQDMSKILKNGGLLFDMKGVYRHTPITRIENIDYVEL